MTRWPCTINKNILFTLNRHTCTSIKLITFNNEQANRHCNQTHISTVNWCISCDQTKIYWQRNTLVLWISPTLFIVNMHIYTVNRWTCIYILWTDENTYILWTDEHTYILWIDEHTYIYTVNKWTYIYTVNRWTYIYILWTDEHTYILWTVEHTHIYCEQAQICR
jgi:hypothetical protein